MINKNIVLVTGGQRSGKTRFSLACAETFSENPVYLATARLLDAEMNARAKKHQAERKPHWKTVEEDKCLSTVSVNSDCVLIDCVTLWLTNVFFDLNENIEQCLEFVEEEIIRVNNRFSTVVWVTNEIGLGVIPADRLSRQFCDLQGWVNQYLAEKSSDVYFMVSGIPQKIK